MKQIRYQNKLFRFCRQPPELCTHFIGKRVDTKLVRLHHEVIIIVHRCIICPTEGKAGQSCIHKRPESRGAVVYLFLIHSARRAIWKLIRAINRRNTKGSFQQFNERGPLSHGQHIMSLSIWCRRRNLITYNNIAPAQYCQLCARKGLYLSNVGDIEGAPVNSPARTSLEGDKSENATPPLEPLQNMIGSHPTFSHSVRSTCTCTTLAQVGQSSRGVLTCSLLPHQWAGR